MTAPDHDRHERLLELCADRALFGLDPLEERELRASGDATIVALECTAFELASAALTAALATAPSSELEAPPETLRIRLAEAGAKFLATGFGESGFGAGGGEAPAAPVASRTLRALPTSRSRAAGKAGWFVAAAAAAAVVVLWIERQSAPVFVPLQVQRSAFLDAHPEARRLAWEKGCRGDVVWSHDAQTGYLLIQGLPPNDPKAFQ